MRWLSPPDSEPELRASVRYSSPTSTRNPSRSLISLRMRRAISRLLVVSLGSSPANQSRASRIERAETWLMSSPAIFTANASGLRRRPSHASHGASFW